jgi:aryl-alcohol dehydrogenase-like predicted oxidoreductase
MRFKPLGRTSMSASVIGQGTLGVGSRENSDPARIRRRIDALRCGFDHGINLVDTGEDYEGGHSEEVLGQALEGMRV